MTATFDAFASVLVVADVGRSIAFYRDVLGFRVHFTMGDPPGYAIVERGAVSLHLMPKARAPAAQGQGQIYIFVSDVDAIEAEVEARGAVITERAKDYDYGMREMGLRDPDGNHLTFARVVGRAERPLPDTKADV